MPYNKSTELEIGGRDQGDQDDQDDPYDPRTLDGLTLEQHVSNIVNYGTIVILLVWPQFIYPESVSIHF